MDHTFCVSSDSIQTLYSICCTVYSAAPQDMLNRHKSRRGSAYLCIYRSSFFSARLSGIALNIRTRSWADRFCKLLTRRSLLFSTNTHSHRSRSAWHNSDVSGITCDFSAFTFFLKSGSVRFHEVSADAGPRRPREVLDGGSALPASAQLHGAVAVLRDDRATTAT